MQMQLSTIALKQLDDLIAKYNDMRKRSKYDDLSDLQDSELLSFITAGLAALNRISGPSSIYVTEVKRNIEEMHWSNVSQKVPFVIGALNALREDIASGYLTSLQELIHASIFADFLEMAEYLLKENYKDAAAVLIGGVLEEHLRKLCIKHDIPIDFRDSKDELRPKKADTINADLGNKELYSKLDQKQVTTWLDLRNKAAHTKYSSYTQEQVEFFLHGLQDFMIRNPA